MRRKNNIVKPLDNNEDIPSPCIKVCKIENNVCQGCHRTMDEIREWFVATNDRKKGILNSVEERLIKLKDQ